MGAGYWNARIQQSHRLGFDSKFSVYLSLGLEFSHTLPEGQRESKTWNAAGELESATDFNGQTTHYAYDVTGRLASIDYPHDADVSFTYNAAGERTNVLDGRGSSTTSYDARGRVLQSLDADDAQGCASVAGAGCAGATGGLIEYQYDAAGNLIARISPSQSLVYAYDARNRLDTVTRTIDGEAPSVTRYTYDEDGNRTTMIGGGGTQTEYGYDSRHRLRSLIKRTAASALLLAMNYNVDATGLRSHIEESDPAGIVRTVDYQYDALKRLTDETIDHRDDLNDRSSHWAYDRVGNRLQQVVSIGGLTTTTDYSYDNNDRLQSETTGGSPTSYSYDANGNTKAKVGPGFSVAYDYNDANRLIQASTSSGTTRYVYNADGLRTRQTHTPIGGTESTTWYVQDSTYPYAQIIEEYQSQGSVPKTLSATYTFADDLVSQTRYDSAGTPATSYIQADGFGSTRWLTDGTGNITDSIDYDAFGVEIRRSGTAEIEHLYRGERFDANVGFYDLRARLYDPANGRFLTQDDFAGSEADPRSLHKYLFAENDPINNSDPSGHFLQDQTIAMQVSATLNLIAAGVTLNAISNFQNRAQLELAKAMVKANAGVNTRRAIRGIPVIFYGSDVNQVTQHIDKAQFEKSITPVLSRYPGRKSSRWVRRTDECRGKTFLGSGLECDEYPFATTNQGGRENYREGVGVSLAPISAIQNSRAGNRLGRFLTQCGVNALSPTKKWYGVIAAADGMATSFSCGDGDMWW